MRAVGFKMPGNLSNSTSPTDIITYVGVPLAVIGVLPIAHSAVAGTLLQHQIKRRLRANHLQAATRTNLYNRIVE